MYEYSDAHSPLPQPNLRSDVPSPFPHSDDLEASYRSCSYSLPGANKQDCAHWWDHLCLVTATWQT